MNTRIIDQQTGDDSRRHAATHASIRAAAALSFLWRLFLAFVMIMFGVWALLQYGEPCAAGSLCMGAAAIPARPGVLIRLRRAASIWVQQWRVRDLEATLERVEADMQALPSLRRSIAVALDAARIKLTDAELGARVR